MYGITHETVSLQSTEQELFLKAHQVQSDMVHPIWIVYSITGKLNATESLSGIIW